MRGRRHNLTLVGQGASTGAPVGSVVRDAEGRWRSPAGGVEGTVSSVSVKGFIGPAKADEVPQGVTADAIAQVPSGTRIANIASVDLVASGTGEPLLDGRYEVTGFAAGGPAVTRLFLRRYAPQATL